MTRKFSFAAIAGMLAVLAVGCSGGGKEAATSTAAPASTKPAALSVRADTVSGPKNLTAEQRKTQSCVQQSRFPRNSQIVWRARVGDGATGSDLDDKTLGTIEVQLADSRKLPMKYGPHPAQNPTDFFWTTSVEIPADYPTGTLGYKIVATAKDGRTVTYEPFKVAPSLLTISEDVLPTQS